MATSRKCNQLQGIDRRKLLLSVAAVPACADIPEAQDIYPGAARSEEQPSTNIQARNLGLITAHRAELSAKDNQARNRELWCDLALCGRVLVRARYVLPDGAAIEAQAFLVFGNPDDSGNLKGLLRKLGRKRTACCSP